MQRSRNRARTCTALACLAWLACFSSVHDAAAQIETNLGSYTGRNAQGYLRPLQEGFGAALQDAFFRSARIPYFGGKLNVEVNAMAVRFGGSDRTFLAVTEEGFEPATQVRAPTVIGDTSAVAVTGQGGSTAVLPGGLDLRSLGVAVPQITIGSAFGTNLVGRYIAFNTGNADLGRLRLIGIGVQHSLSQYLEFLPFDLAVGGSWQRFRLGERLVRSTATSAGVQASRSFSVLEPFAGVSYDRFGMSVEYTARGEQLKVRFPDRNRVRTTAGIGINLALVHLHGEIGFSSQRSYAAGVSLGN